LQWIFKEIQVKIISYSKIPLPPNIKPSTHKKVAKNAFRKYLHSIKDRDKYKRKKKETEAREERRKPSQFFFEPHLSESNVYNICFFRRVLTRTVLVKL
jgi:hypothetical protein